MIASQVVEHVPDPIGWFREIAAVLRPGGVLSLAIPDKRWTSDCRREVTSVSEWIESHLERHRRATMRHCVDYFGELAVVPGPFTVADLWQGKASFNQVPLSDPDWFETFGEAGLRTVLDSFRNGVYYDVHCQVFTPFSFVRILSALARLGMFGFRIASFRETAVDDMEFFVTLAKLPDSLDAASRARIILDSLPVLPPPLLDGEIRVLLAERGTNSGANAEGAPETVTAAPQEDTDTPSADGNETIAALQRDLVSAQAAQRTAEAEAILQRSRADAMQADVNHLLSSTSWRITAPLRAVKRLIGRRT